MKRTVWLAVTVLCLFAETGRDAYRAAYRQWREADPNLERDSSALSADLAARVSKVAAQAAKYGTERGAFIRQLAADQERSLAQLDTPVANLGELTRGVRENVATEQAVVKRNIDQFARDQDPGIAPLKAALDRENTALSALASAVAERQSAADAEKSAANGADQARVKAGNENRDLIGAMKAAADESDREASAWADYYKKLLASARGEAPLTSPATPLAAGAAAPVERAPLRTSITPLPLARYTGAWVFPSGGLFHGPQPEFVDLVVHEENGKADGTLFARFKVASGDPVLRFDFSGDFKNSRNQTFALETSDGAKGTVELIPGPAFNLLEVNFQTEPKAGKIRQGNIVLVKK